MAAPEYLAVGVIHAADDQNASMAAAMTSITAEPNTMMLVSLAASSSAAVCWILVFLFFLRRPYAD